MEKKKQFRQGDVLIDYEHPAQPAKRLPREAGAVVLAHGEVTGHRHAIDSRNCSLFAVEGNQITGETAMQIIARLGGGLIPDKALKSRRPVDLYHDEHSTVRLPAGTARVTIQREYSPQSLRSVAD